MLSKKTKKKVGVILMTYGSATTAEHVRDYFERIYPGKVLPELIADFENRYRVTGGSPLIRITQEQAALLEKELGAGYVVHAGMRHSTPFINEAVAECKASGAETLVGIILSPQFSSFIMEGYRKAFLAAAQQNGIEDAVVAEQWQTEEHFIELLGRRVRDKLAVLGNQTPIVFTTHSLPQRVVEKDPSYLNQLQQTIDAVRTKLDPKIEWYQGYQSAGHTPEEWLKPDLTDILSDLEKKGHSSVLIVPIQFLADHLEILYDLDIAAKEQCDDAGINYNRIELPNTDPLFIKVLAVVQSKVRTWEEKQARRKEKPKVKRAARTTPQSS
jgi:ferrochelatase